MRKYRIKQIGDKFYPQEKSCFFFWVNIKLQDRATRDWFFTVNQNYHYNGTVKVQKDAWEETLWVMPEFKTLESAKLFIEEYKNFLETEYDKQKVKYYYQCKQFFT